QTGDNGQQVPKGLGIDRVELAELLHASASRCSMSGEVAEVEQAVTFALVPRMDEVRLLLAGQLSKRERHDCAVRVERELLQKGCCRNVWRPCETATRLEVKFHSLVGLRRPNGLI